MSEYQRLYDLVLLFTESSIDDRCKKFFNWLLPRINKVILESMTQDEFFKEYLKHDSKLLENFKELDLFSWLHVKMVIEWLNELYDLTQ
jgi:hypothetical protein